MMVGDDAKQNSLAATVQLVMPLGPALVIDLLLQDGTSIKLSMPRAQAIALEHGMVVNLSLRDGTQPAVFASA